MKKIKCFYFLILLLFLFEHLYKLSSLPFAINVDEAGLWYNVQCLLNYGVDQGNNSWPILFTNFYGEQSAMYTYLAFICCKIFGDSLFAIRLPAFFNSCLILFFGYKIVNKLYNSDKINLLFCALCTICPYFIINNRIALDCNLMLGFSTMFLWFFMKAIDTQKMSDMFIAGITCGLILWTYAISYIAVPLFAIFACSYLLLLRKIDWKQILIFTIPLVLLGIPLLIVQLIDIFDLQEIMIGNITLTKFEYSRLGSIGLENILPHIIVLSKYILMGSETALRTSLFCSNFYLISIPFLICGMILCLKRLFEKKFNLMNIILLWGIAVFLTLLTIKNGLNHYQTNAIMFVCLIFIIEGFCYTFSKLKKSNIKRFLIILLSIVYLFSFCMFSYHYFLGDYNNNVYLYERADENISDVLEYIGDKPAILILKPIYYKIATDDSPTLHPFKYEAIYDEQGYFIEYKDVVPPYGNIICDRYGESLNNITTNNIYVVPSKRDSIIQKLDKCSEFTKTQLGHYYIYERIEN